MRHKDVATTRKFYIKSISSDVKAAMDQLSKVLTGMAKKRAKRMAGRKASPKAAPSGRNVIQANRTGHAECRGTGLFPRQRKWESVGSAGAHRQTSYNAAALAPGVA